MTEKGKREESRNDRKKEKERKVEMTEKGKKRGK